MTPKPKAVPHPPQPAQHQPMPGETKQMRPRPDHVREFGASTPLGRAGQPAEVAPAFVLLASNEASYITGALLPVTGGRLML